MNPTLRVPDHLAHIAQAMERIFRYVNSVDEADFLHNELLQDAVLRNRISHGYDTVDLPLVWQTIRQNLPALHAQIQALRAEMAQR